MKEEQSAWQREYEDIATFPVLSDHLKTDVVIIGGGMAGVLTAYMLAQVGKKVIVLEREFPTRSVTSKTTGFLVADIDTATTDLKKIFGFQTAQLILQSGVEAIDEFEKIIKKEEIDCEFMRCNQYIYALSGKERETLGEEMLLIKKCGLKITENCKDDLPISHSGFSILHNQAKFDPLQFLYAVRKKAIEYGATFFENTEVLSFSGDKEVSVVAEGGRVTADQMIMTTHRPFKNPWSLFAKKGMYLSYVLEYDIPKGSLPEALYVDYMDPYHYFRVDSKGKTDRLMLGGEDHREELPIKSEKNFNALRSYAKRIFGSLPLQEVGRWMGPIYESIDGLPFIGRFEKKYPNRYIATTFSGNGLTYSMISAMIFRDLILKKKNPYSRIYNPLRRIRIRALLIKTRDYVNIFIFGWLKNIWRKKV